METMFVIITEIVCLIGKFSDKSQAILIFIKFKIYTLI